MHSAPESTSGRRLAGWVAVASCPIAWLNIYCFLAATDFDTEAIFHPAVALTLSTAALQMFRWSMLADSFGFYLPFLVMGGYLWSRLRPNPLVDMATLGLVVYVFLGLAGTSIQLATLPILSELHDSGDAVARSAAEATWLAIVHGTEKGLWWMEGPLMAFWAIVVGTTSKSAGLRYGSLLTLAGIAYGGYFILAFAGTNQIAELLIFAGLLLLPLWMLLVGIELLREHPAASSDSAD